jgi:hypothetical protein
MGGNVRHADKGPDRSESTCNDCQTSFTHGQYVHRNFCGSCREEKRSNAEINTDVEVVEESDGLKVVIKIINQSDVDVKIPIQSPDSGFYDKVTLYGIIGYIRLKGDEWRAEDAVLVDCKYSEMGVRSGSSRSFEFKIRDNDVIQDNKPKQKFCDEIGEDFRDDIKMTRGEINNTDTISVLFQPTCESEIYLNSSADSIDI